MKMQVTTTITTSIDAETFDTDHAVEIVAENGVAEQIARAAAIGGARALLKALDTDDSAEPSGSAADSDDEAPDESEGAEVVVHKNLEVGERVYLDEDVYLDPPVHTPARVFLFEQFDSAAPAESNCTLVDEATGDWTVRGIGELVPVDEQPVDDDADDEGLA